MISDSDLQALATPPSAGAMVSSLFHYLFGHGRHATPEHGPNEMQLHTFRTTTAETELDTIKKPKPTSTGSTTILSHEETSHHDLPGDGVGGAGESEPLTSPPMDLQSNPPGSSATNEDLAAARFCLRFMRCCLQRQTNEDGSGIISDGGYLDPFSINDLSCEEGDPGSAISSLMRLSEVCKDGIAPW